MKVTIAGGGGGVGASVAFNLLAAGDGDYDVVLVDRRPEMITSHVMDLEQVLALGGRRSVRGGDASDYADADVLVLTAAAPLVVNTSRHVYLGDNAEIVRAVIDALPARWDGVLLMVTNPVDPLLTWVHRRAGLDRRRLVGYTLNDNLRLQAGIAQALDVPAADVEAWVVGEHGDACVPLWGRVTLAGAPIELDAGQRAEAEEYLRTWYEKHVALDSGRTSTWTSGAGVARMVAAIGAGSSRPWPASVVLDGEYGQRGIALSVPVVFSPDGDAEIVAWELDDDERARVGAAAAVVAEAAASIDAVRANT